MSFGSFSLRELTCTHVYIWRCEHARFCVDVFYALYINLHSFIHTEVERDVADQSKQQYNDPPQGRTFNNPITLYAVFAYKNLGL